jgi:hypothetical protein
MRVVFALTWFLLLAAPAAYAAGASIDSTAALKLARELRPHVSAGEPGPLWSVFDAKMRTAMGDSTRFAAAMDGIHAQVGAIREVLSEDLTREQEVWVYRASCRFEKTEDPLLLLIALTGEGRIAGLAVRPQPKEYASPFLEYVTKTPLQLPFRDDEWYVFWGGRTLSENYHAASRAQRFAMDLVIRRGESSHAGDGTNLTDYYCYGVEIVAPADGQVVWSCDSLPDQKPGQMDPRQPIGNGVVIDHGNGECSLLAHMQPGSLRVRTGDRVKTGDSLGKCGNSGNTSEPHLHYHLQNGADMKTAEGLPSMFVDACVDGKKAERAQPVRGQRVKRCP